MARLVHVGVVLALATGLWLDLGLVSNGSLYGLLLKDPWYSVLEQRELTEKRDLRVSGMRTLAFFGDSTCLSVKSGDAADAAVPSLGLLVQRRLSGPTGLLPGDWRVVLALSSDPPRAAIIVVNMRSLNRLGFNGFGQNAGSVRPMFPVSEFAARQGLRYRIWTDMRDAVRLSLPAAVFRGLMVWSREGLVDLITPDPLPDPLPDPDAPLRRPEDVVRANFRRVYGDGYELNEKTLESLISVGTLLGARGCKTLYYLTPVDRNEVAGLGPDALRQLDAGAAKAAGYLRQAGYPVLDLHALLDDGFIDPPSEHLAAAGREKVAQRLSTWADEQLFPGNVQGAAAPDRRGHPAVPSAAPAR